MQIPVYPSQISEGLIEQHENQNKRAGGEESDGDQRVWVRQASRGSRGMLPPKHPCL